MKTPPFLLYGCPTIILIIIGLYLATYRELERLPFHAALVAQERAGFGEVHAVLIQLDLTDAQWGQIQRLRETVSDRKQRLQAILHILTPAQRTRFDALRAAQARTETPSVPAS